MKFPRILLLGLLALAVTVAGCARGFHLGGSDPSPSPSGTQQAAGAGSGKAESGPPQLGIDVDFYASSGMDVAAIARQDMAYIKHLNANSVSISFPFFMHGSNSSQVYATSATPSPSDLATVARIAEADGLYVSIRPLLDEGNLGESRVHWVPAHPAAWFANYRRFLLPYARMAQAAHIPEIVTGVEFSEFGTSPYWNSLDTALRKVYSGKLSYANNWGKRLHVDHIVNAAGVQQTIDAYKPLKLSANASQAQVTAAWDAYARSLPRGIVLSEVGIAAQSGAYTAPFRLRWWKGRPLRPAIQVRWFTAACHAVRADHLGGIYFWVVNFGQSLTTPPTIEDATAFVDAPGARAISTCFRRLGGSSS